MLGTVGLSLGGLLLCSSTKAESALPRLIGPYDLGNSLRRRILTKLSYEIPARLSVRSKDQHRAGLSLRVPEGQPDHPRAALAPVTPPGVSAAAAAPTGTDAAATAIAADPASSVSPPAAAASRIRPGTAGSSSAAAPSRAAAATSVTRWGRVLGRIRWSRPPPGSEMVDSHPEEDKGAERRHRDTN